VGHPWRTAKECPCGKRTAITSLIKTLVGLPKRKKEEPEFWY
jgi:hypothetical protein